MWDDGFSSQRFNNQMENVGMDANTKCREMYSLKRGGIIMKTSDLSGLKLNSHFYTHLELSSFISRGATIHFGCSDHGIILESSLSFTCHINCNHTLNWILLSKYICSSPYIQPLPSHPFKLAPSFICQEQRFLYITDCIYIYSFQIHSEFTAQVITKNENVGILL